MLARARARYPARIFRAHPVTGGQAVSPASTARQVDVIFVFTLVHIRATAGAVTGW